MTDEELKRPVKILEEAEWYATKAGDLDFATNGRDVMRELVAEVRRLRAADGRDLLKDLKREWAATLAAERRAERERCIKAIGARFVAEWRG